MVTYYVRKTGSDSNAGTSSGAAWLTIGKALLAGSPVVGGDTVYVGAGTYREVPLIGITPTSNVNVIADVDGANTGDAGEIIWTSYLTNDTKAASLTQLVRLNGKSFLTFDSFILVSGASTVIDGFSTTGSHDITFKRCAMFSFGATMTQYTGNTAAANWLFDQCVSFVASSSDHLVISAVDPAAASDLDLNFLIRNCRFIGGGSVLQPAAPGSIGNTGKPGGVRLRQCTLIGTNRGVLMSPSANWSTSIPLEVYNCFVCGIGDGINTGTAGTIVEDFNVIFASTPRTNVTAGANSIAGATFATLFEMGQDFITGRQPRMPGTPALNSPLSGYGATTAFTPPTVDLLNRDRPSGGSINSTQASDSGTRQGAADSTSTLTDSSKSWTVNQWIPNGTSGLGYKVKITGGTGNGQIRRINSNTATILTVSPVWTTTPDNTSTYSIYNPGADNAVGCLERHDFAAKDTTSGEYDVSPSINMYGPGDLEFQIPVDTVSNTISIKVQRDANYGAGTKPTLELLANGEVGVTGQSVADTGAASAFNTITLGAFTPTATGVVKIRLHSYAAAIGKVQWDSLAVA